MCRMSVSTKNQNGTWNSLGGWESGVDIHTQDSSDLYIQTWIQIGYSRYSKNGLCYWNDVPKNLNVFLAWNPGFAHQGGIWVFPQEKDVLMSFGRLGRHFPNCFGKEKYVPLTPINHVQILNTSTSAFPASFAALGACSPLVSRK